jgi:hypothetical protein
VMARDPINVMPGLGERTRRTIPCPQASAPAVPGGARATVPKASDSP